MKSTNRIRDLESNFRMFFQFNSPIFSQCSQQPNEGIKIFFSLKNKKKIIKKIKIKNQNVKKKSISSLISNESLLIKKENTHVHWQSNWVAVHQTLKLQCSNISNKLEQRGELKAILQSRKERRRRDLILSIDHSLPSNHLAFFFHQRHHRTQCGTGLQKTMFQCLLNGPCQAEYKSVTLCGITHRRPNKFHTLVHNSTAMGQWRKRWSTYSPLLCT